MNAWTLSICNYFSRDNEAHAAALAVIKEGKPLCVVSDCIEQYARQTLTVFAFDAVEWHEAANLLIMDYLGAEPAGAPGDSIPEWSDRFDSNEI